MTFTDLLWRVVGALAIVGGSALAGGWLSVITSVAATRRGVSAQTSRALESGVVVVATAVGAVLALEYLFGLPMISLGAVVGALLLAVALASVPLLANGIGGLGFRIRERLVVGATIRAGPHEGQIVGSDWLGVRLARPGSEVWIPWVWLLVVPAEVRGDVERRSMGVPLTLGADVDLVAARALLLTAASSVDGLHDDPAPEVVVRAITVQGVEVELRATADPARFVEARSALIETVVTTLRGAGVEVAA